MYAVDKWTTAVLVCFLQSVSIRGNVYHRQDSRWSFFGASFEGMVKMNSIPKDIPSDTYSL